MLLLNHWMQGTDPCKDESPAHLPFCRDTTVAKIMTKGPMCVTSDTSATDALNLMVSRGFRHLVKEKK